MSFYPVQYSTEWPFNSLFKILLLFILTMEQNPTLAQASGSHDPWVILQTMFRIFPPAANALTSPRLLKCVMRFHLVYSAKKITLLSSLAWGFLFIFWDYSKGSNTLGCISWVPCEDFSPSLMSNSILYIFLLSYLSMTFSHSMAPTCVSTWKSGFYYILLAFFRAKGLAQSWHFTGTHLNVNGINN